MARPDFDVVVAGAGAGGAACAYHLTQAGLDVLLVDKARLPRYKPCGGAIPRPALAALPFAFDGLVRASPTVVGFTQAGLPPQDAPLPDRPIAMVRRSEFDAFLAAKCGAEVLDGQAVTAVDESPDGVEVTVGERRLRARYLVGADGASSVVARRLDLRAGRELGGTLEGEVPLDGDDGLRERYGDRAVFALGALPWGYAWVFPKGDRLSVGIGHFRRGRVDLYIRLRRTMAALGIDLAGVALHGHPIPIYRAQRGSRAAGRGAGKIATQRCLLVGDAAGLVDPFIGEGIRYALASARLAAQAIAAEDVASYETAIEREMGHSLATAARVAALFYRWPWLCYQLGVRNPRTILLFSDLLTGRTNYVGIARRLMAATARWVLGEVVPLRGGSYDRGT